MNFFLLVGLAIFAYLGIGLLVLYIAIRYTDMEIDESDGEYLSVCGMWPLVLFGIIVFTIANAAKNKKEKING